MGLCEAQFAESARAISYLKSVYHDLAGQADLSPENPLVTGLLSELVHCLGAWHRANFGADLADAPDMQDVALGLPLLCAEAETQMEKWWCRRLLARREAGALYLPSFWYYDNYRSLVEAEWALADPAKIARVVCLGCGALPLTALLLAEKTRCPITCADRDAETCELAAQLVHEAGLAEYISIACLDAADVALRPDDLVLCASLLEGSGHYARLAEAQAGQVIVRDAEGVFRFCYRPAAPLPKPYTAVSKSPASGTHINTSVLYVPQVGAPVSGLKATQKS